MTTPPVVRLERGSLARGGRTVWRDVDLTVAGGELVTVVGPNGAGKSSLLQVLLGMLPLAAGTVEIDGGAPRRAARSIGFVPQHAGFEADLPLRGADLVRLGVDGHRWGLPSLRRSPAVAEALARVGATAFARRPVGRLSGGEQQRLRIAQALATRPRLLLCDEPFASLDSRSCEQVAGVLDGVRRDGTAVVVVTHDLHPVAAMTDLVVHIEDGHAEVGRPTDGWGHADLLPERRVGR